MIDLSITAGTLGLCLGTRCRIRRIVVEHMPRSGLFSPSEMPVGTFNICPAPGSATRSEDLNGWIRVQSPNFASIFITGQPRETDRIETDEDLLSPGDTFKAYNSVLVI